MGLSLLPTMENAEAAAVFQCFKVLEDAWG